MFNVKEMMQQAQQVQFKMQELQEKFKDITVEGEAGDGLVKVTLSCAGVVKALYIDQTLVDGGSKDMIEDLVIAALNVANENKDKRINEETEAMMGKLGLPADIKLPGS